MDSKLEDMIKRVRALLVLAEDEGATEAEAELATARAAELMARYSIDAAMLAAAADVREIPVDKIVEFEDPYAKQHMYLYFHILRAFGGDAVVIDRPRKYSRTKHTMTLQVYGFEADLMAVDILYTSLLLQGINRSKRVPDYEHARSWRVSFWAGFTAQVYKRLTETHTAVEVKGTPGTEIVLRDRKLAVQDRKNADHGKLQSYGGSTIRSEHGYRSGEEAGRAANLHNQASAGQARRTAIG